ncbi:putative amidase AmiD [Paraburkholderia sacchari]|uniref:amidase n=1 Tax=Paraburkholderia sacchari TaxID=159450 RepID=UPI0039A6D96C
MHYWTLAEVSRAIQERKVSPVDVTRAILDRIEATASRHQAFVTVLADRALRQAKQAEAELASGFWRGPLHGVPLTAKDIIFTDFAPTTAGQVFRRNQVPVYTATVIERLERAGAVTIGKVKTVEGAWTEHHVSESTPPNPWNPEYWQGTSSSGSGVSVALGLGYGSLGSCTGGSIRMPSQACGIVGIKPTWGRVSRHGVYPLAQSLDHIGPMTRTVEDAAIMLETIAGKDPNDPTSLSAAVPNYHAECMGNIKGMRIGIDREYVFDGTRADVAEAVNETLRVLIAAGASIHDVKLPSYRDAIAAWQVQLHMEVALAHAETYPAHKHEYGPALAGIIEAGQKLTPAMIAEHALRRQIYSTGLDEVFDSVDVILVPVTPQGVPTRAEAAALRDDIAAEFIKFTAPFNFSGAPTVTVPAGFGPNGLPIGIQFVGRRLAEAQICRAGAAFQRLTDWHTKHPPEGEPGVSTDVTSFH